jgi:hypothetical protein
MRQVKNMMETIPVTDEGLRVFIRQAEKEIRKMEKFVELCQTRLKNHKKGV